MESIDKSEKKASVIIAIPIHNSNPRASAKKQNQPAPPAGSCNFADHLHRRKTPQLPAGACRNNNNRIELEHV